MKSILLVTEQYDPTADNLILVLRQRGCPVLRWNLDKYPLGSALTYCASAQEFAGRISVDGRVAPLDAIGSVWYRALRCRGFPADLKPQEREFAFREAEATINSLPAVTEWFWMNHPDRHREAAWKPAQLDLARRVGLNVPRTVITNDPDEARAFRKQCSNGIVYKPLSQTMALEPGKIAFTGIVTDQMAASLDLIAYTPGIFQELVPKAYEIRLTVVGGRMFAAKIRSQEFEKTRIDWRTAPYEVAYEPMELPQEIENKVDAFMRKSGLVYSCLDFIVRPDGEYVFLESNPRGQYLWIEHYTDLPITEAIAVALAESCR